MRFRLSRKITIRAIICLFLLWALVLPFVMQKKSNEKLSDIPASASGEAVDRPGASAQSEVLATGSFRGLRGQSGSGNVSLLKIGEKHYVRLEDNFTVSNGPDLLIGFGADEKVSVLGDKLKANSGGQNYELPADFDPDKHQQVFIHCRAFKYSFAVADLQKRQ